MKLMDSFQNQRIQSNQDVPFCKSMSSLRRFFGLDISNAKITKTGGMRVTLTGKAGETRTVTSQPIREEQTNQQSIELNLEKNPFTE